VRVDELLLIDDTVVIEIAATGFVRIRVEQQGQQVGHRGGAIAPARRQRLRDRAEIALHRENAVALDVVEAKQAAETTLQFRVHRWGDQPGGVAAGQTRGSSPPRQAVGSA
jgi:hypothetical protein